MGTTRDQSTRMLVAAALVVSMVLGVSARARAVEVTRDAAAVAEGDLLRLTNADRRLNGLPPLADEPLLHDLARNWAAEVARRGALSHNPDLAAQVARVLPGWRRAGENVGYAGSTAQVQSAYMASSGHRANILGDYDRVGIGIVWVGSRQYSVVVFVAAGARNAPAAAPFDSSGEAAGLLATRLQHRPSTIADRNALDDRVAAEGVPAVAAALEASPAHRNTSEPVIRLYAGYFGRLPDVGGYLYWTGALAGGVPATAVSADFARSREFQSTYGNLDNPRFVDLVYRNVLGRAPDSGGRAYWVSELDSGRRTRGDVMLGFTESAEFRQRMSARVRVVGVYLSLLDRQPDQAGLDYWERQINAGVAPSTMTQAIAASSEFAATDTDPAPLPTSRR